MGVMASNQDNRPFVGSQLRQLRKERGISQARLAELLGLSASYVNQIEHDGRPLTISVLEKITDTFGVDPTFFSHQDVTLDSELLPNPVDVTELAEMVKNHPTLARAFVDMHSRYRNVADKLSLLTEERMQGSAIMSITPPRRALRPRLRTGGFLHAP